MSKETKELAQSLGEMAKDKAKDVANTATDGIMQAIENMDPKYAKETLGTLFPVLSLPVKLLIVLMSLACVALSGAMAYEMHGLPAQFDVYDVATICALPLVGILLLCGWVGAERAQQDLLVCMITYTLLFSLTVTSFFSMPVTRFWIPMITVPLSTASLSQRAHIQYSRVLLTKGEAISTAVAHGMTVTIIHSMCSIERIRFMVFQAAGACLASADSCIFYSIVSGRRQAAAPCRRGPWPRFRRAPHRAPASRQ